MLHYLVAFLKFQYNINQIYPLCIPSKYLVITLVITW